MTERESIYTQRTAAFMVPYKSDVDIRDAYGYLTGFMDMADKTIDVCIKSLIHTGKMKNTNKDWDNVLKRKGVRGGRKVINDIKKAVNNNPNSEKPFVVFTVNYMSDTYNFGRTLENLYQKHRAIREEAEEIFMPFMNRYGADMLIPPLCDD